MTEKNKKRFNSIDVYRGFAVLTMIFFNTLSNFEGIPSFLQHGSWNTMTFVDLVAPFFLFIVGVCMYISISRRRKIQSKIQIAKHILRRNAILIVGGLIFDIIARLQFGPTWGVLESIGVSALIAYLIIRYPIKIRAAFAFGLSLLYSLLFFLPTFNEWVMALPHGGIPGNISWALILIFGTIVGEKLVQLRENDFMKYLLKVGIPLILAGFILQFIIPLNKVLVSSSYSILSAGISVLFLLVFFKLVESDILKFNFFREFGVNAIAGFFLHQVVISVLVLTLVPSFVSGLEAIVLVSVLTVLNWLVVYGLNKKNIILKI